MNCVKNGLKGVYSSYYPFEGGLLTADRGFRNPLQDTSENAGVTIEQCRKDYNNDTLGLVVSQELIDE